MTQKCSSGGGGGDGGTYNSNNSKIVRSSNSKKEKKTKKVPQRGLGVAQLERIRIEEQQKKEASTSSPPSAKPINPSSSSSSSAIPFSVHQNTETLMNPSNSSSTMTCTDGATAVPWPSSTVPILHHHQGYGNSISVHKLYNTTTTCDFSLEKESSGEDRPNLSTLLPFETIPVWPHPSLMQKSQLFQHPSSSSTMILEPPSNQSNYSNHNYPLIWPQEEKMVGIKRPHQFPHPRVSRPEDSASCGNTISREASEPNISKRNMKENGVLNGGFLTLAPPTASTASFNQGSKFKNPPHFHAFNTTFDNHFPDFDPLTPYHQARLEDRHPRPGQNERQPYYSFIPQATSTMKNYNNGEVGESIDLNLKL